MLANDDVLVGGGCVSLDGCGYQPNYTHVIDISDISFLSIDHNLQ